MLSCRITKGLDIMRGSLDDYHRLARYHYRENRLGPHAAIFAIRPSKRLAARAGTKTIGVIVYRTPSPSVELRSLATDNFLKGFDRKTQMTLLNKNVRCISRVIIEPRFRSLGLAGRLVRETMPKINVPIIEAMAVMGQINPFLEKAGMKPYIASRPVRCAQLIEAFSAVGIEEKELIDAVKVQRKLEQLATTQAEFIERQIKHFLKAYGRRRDMQPSLRRTKYILSRLTTRAVYYIWFNPKLDLITD
jgi:hypothetical protein